MPTTEYQHWLVKSDDSWQSIAICLTNQEKLSRGCCNTDDIIIPGGTLLWYSKNIHVEHETELVGMDASGLTPTHSPGCHQRGV